MFDQDYSGSTDREENKESQAQSAEENGSVSQAQDGAAHTQESAAYTESSVEQESSTAQESVGQQTDTFREEESARQAGTSWQAGAARQLEPFAFLGTSEIASFFSDVKKEINNQLEILGYLKTLYDSRLSQTRDIEELLSQHVNKNKIFNTTIRKNVALSEASNMQKTIFEYAPESTGAKNYRDFTNEIIQLTK